MFFQPQVKNGSESCFPILKLKWVTVINTDMTVWKWTDCYCSAELKDHPTPQKDMNEWMKIYVWCLKTSTQNLACSQSDTHSAYM